MLACHEEQDRVKSDTLYGPSSQIEIWEPKSRYRLPITLIDAHPTSMMAEAEALPRKKKICTGHRVSATRILGQTTTALAGTPLDADRLSILKLTLDEKLETLKGLDAEIIELEYKERMYDALTRIHRAVNSPPTPATAGAARTLTPTGAPHEQEAKFNFFFFFFFFFYENFLQLSKGKVQ